MSFESLFHFLKDLEANNHKAWMDEHRSRYHGVRDFFIDWLDTMNELLAQVDSEYTDTPGKRAINRINNNLLYHPNKPVYKDHFGAGLDQVRKEGDFYIQLGSKESFIGGGYWHPSAKTLKNIRAGIDYNGDVLKEIIHKPSFKKTFGGLIEHQELKTAPKGFSQDHPHIDLLRKKSFAVMVPLTLSTITASSFNDLVIEIYKELLPFRRYLNEAAQF